jgi:predicted amidohydrolase
MWDDTPESQAEARRSTRDWLKTLRLRAQENSCFYVIADQAGRAGYVDMYPRDSRNQPHHAGGAFVFDPVGRCIAETQATEIRDEMIVATLDAAALAEVRSQPNYTLRTRRPELFDELVRPQVTA